MDITEVAGYGKLSEPASYLDKADNLPVTPENAGEWVRNHYRYGSGDMPELEKIGNAIKGRFPGERTPVEVHFVPPVWMPTNARFSKWDGTRGFTGSYFVRCWDEDGRYLGTYHSDGIYAPGLMAGDWTPCRPGKELI